MVLIYKKGREKKKKEKQKRKRRSLIALAFYVTNVMMLLPMIRLIWTWITVVIIRNLGNIYVQ